MTPLTFPRFWLWLALSSGAGALAAAPAQVSAPAPTPASPSAPASAATAFDPIAQVLMHPRCINCHQVEAPRQTDRRTIHTQGVLRGKDGRGAVGMACASCHQQTNVADGRVPGANNWHLAPLSMNWQGLGKGAICRQIQDPARNGNHRGPAKVIEHMVADPLVLWAWEPGAARTRPPLSHAAFVAALRAWAAQGMPCPP